MARSIRNAVSKTKEFMLEVAGVLWCCCGLCILSTILCIDKDYLKRRAPRGHKQEQYTPRWPPVPSPRQRALTLPLSAPTNIQKTLDQSQSALMWKLPLEIRQVIYKQALGHTKIHLTGDLEGLYGIRCSENHTCRHRVFSDQFELELKISTPLLRTCRQIYSEAVEFLYTANEFSIAPSRNHSALPFLPFFLISQRINQIRFLHVSWPVSSWSLTVMHESVFDHWLYPWGIIQHMSGLKNLFVELWPMESTTHVRGAWLRNESVLLEVVKKVTAPTNFTVILPVLECSTDVDMGDSHCILKLPERVEENS
ncbi:hypothetical protein K491DRAFT_761564 [Lophiostoma macrostomum CBS 122681]|uniref:DUF7730 domain-containing protein n=1 Tax=Lophiostoma macrostomum CBS 122681 TaxID=1314788 RepID=A0A6A6SSV9_9PLEO|nr:hypothetical protein K491DRAFT_761564 [Lophiostoma macrostomum CBS 122681]